MYIYWFTFLSVADAFFTFIVCSTLPKKCLHCVAAPFSSNKWVAFSSRGCLSSSTASHRQVCGAGSVRAERRQGLGGSPGAAPATPRQKTKEGCWLHSLSRSSWDAPGADRFSAGAGVWALGWGEPGVGVIGSPLPPLLGILRWPQPCPSQMGGVQGACGTQVLSREGRPLEPGTGASSQTCAEYGSAASGVTARGSVCLQEQPASVGNERELEGLCRAWEK